MTETKRYSKSMRNGTGRRYPRHISHRITISPHACYHCLALPSCTQHPQSYTKSSHPPVATGEVDKPARDLPSLPLTKPVQGAPRGGGKVALSEWIGPRFATSDAACALREESLCTQESAGSPDK